MPRLLAATTFIILCLSCNVARLQKQAPTYIHIDSFQFPRPTGFNPTPSASHAIPVVWAYYNNNPVGEFDLPATFPVITDGITPGHLELYPGIMIDGLNDNLDIYPFYYPDMALAFTPQPGNIINYSPQTGYFKDTKIGWNADFNTGGTGFGLAAGNIRLDTVATHSLVFEGAGSGSIYLSSPGDSSVDSSAAFQIPAGEAYIEFDYKSDVPFYVWLQSNLNTLSTSASSNVFGINPGTSWQKFYINITQFTQQYPGTSYNFYIQTSLPAGQANGRLLLDNMELVTF